MEQIENIKNGNHYAIRDNYGRLHTSLTNIKNGFGNSVVQAVLGAAGNAAFKMQGSLDGQNWVDISGATVTITGGITGATTIADRWIYIRPVVTTNATQNLTIILNT